MKLRCSAGCLAIVIKDTEPCRMNIGRVVQVRGPVEFSQGFKGLATWLIRPVTAAPFAVEYRRRGLSIERVYWKSRAEHPDAWLWPLRPKLEDAICVQQAKLQASRLPGNDHALSRAALIAARIIRDDSSGIRILARHADCTNRSRVVI